MAPWKQILLKFLGVGIGIGIGIAASLAFFLWYSSRPKPEKPWNSNAITATFHMVDTAGEDKHLRFVYILENHTDHDYRVQTSELFVSAVVQEQDSLAGAGHIKFRDESVFLPSKQHAVVVLELPDYHYPGENPQGDTQTERQKYREAVKKYVHEELPKLNGFAAFDQLNRYRINFPNGWQQ